jgi:hypothetical protein
MQATIPERNVAKRNDVTVKVDAEVARLAKIVAAYRDASVAEYLSDTLLPIVRRDLEQEQAGPRFRDPPRGSRAGADTSRAWTSTPASKSRSSSAASRCPRSPSTTSCREPGL